MTGLLSYLHGLNHAAPAARRTFYAASGELSWAMRREQVPRVGRESAH